MKRRKSRIALVFLAILLGSSVSTVLLTISFSMNDQLAEEFRKYGANIIVLPRSSTIDVGLPGVTFGSITEQSYIQESDLWRIKRIDNWSGNVLGYAPFLYQLVDIKSSGSEGRAVMAGTYFQHDEPKGGEGWSTGLTNIATYWDIEGNWVSGDFEQNGSLVGVRLAEDMGLRVGMSYWVAFRESPGAIAKVRHLSVDGIVTTGGAEDDQIFVNLAVAQNLSSRPGKVHTVQVSALCNLCPAEEIAWEIEKSLPTVEAKSLLQLVDTESELIGKIQGLFGLVTAVALATSVLGATTIMTGSVIERRREIGIMMALGAKDRTIGGLFLAEAAGIGLLGGIAGYWVGFLLASLIAQKIFDLSVATSWSVFMAVAGISLAVAILACALPIYRALKIEPAVVLRGD